MDVEKGASELLDLRTTRREHGQQDAGGLQVEGFVRAAVL